MASLGWSDMPCLNVEQAGNNRSARNAGKVLHVQLFEISAPTDPEKLDKIRSTENSNTQARPQSFVTCDQSKVLLDVFSRRHAHQAASSAWYFRKNGYKFDLHRNVDRIYMHMELDLKNGHLCQTSVTIPLVNIPTSTDLEAQLKGARLDARWVDMQAGFKLAIGLIYTERTGPHLDIFKDFDTHGMFSKHVLKLTKKDTRQFYAARRLVGSLRRHQPFLAAAEDDLRIAAFLCQANWDERVMMISPRVEGGHLFYYLQQERTFGLERSRIYIAELILIFESMCSHGFIQQDLRPLAIKLGCRGHVMYCDFDLYQSGSAMKPDIPISWQENRYLAPEAFTQLESNNSTVAWSLGAALFEMLHGVPPFYDEDPFTFKANLCARGEIDLRSLPQATVNFLTCLLRKDPSKRLGSTSLSDIKSHEFFNGMGWDWLSSRERVATFVPSPDHDPGIPEIAGVVRRERWSFGSNVDTWESFRRTPPDIKKLASNLQKCGRKSSEVARINRTVELGFAVRQNDMGTVLQLLLEGAHCDFAKDDYRNPALHPSFDCDLSVDLFHKEDFVAPLVYAIGNRNEDQVLVLLTHGADANSAFHALRTKYCCPGVDQDDVLTCGNVVQLAVALRLDEITHHLITAGAIIDSKLCNPEKHMCPGINRILSHRILKRTTLAVL